MTEFKEEVVISGISGLFPECDNADELKDLLFNKNNGVTINSTRWNPMDERSGVSGTGKSKKMDKFDAMFFSAHPKLALVMDPMTRLCLERSVEAIIDAGLSPVDLCGTNTAVFTGSGVSETEMFIFDSSRTAAFSMLGRSRTMQANRVSYVLNLQGPSYTTNGGWICGSNCLEKAKEMIQNGHINAAIVGVTNLVLTPEMQLQYEGLNRLTKGVHTKPFSSDADGYNRSEACIFMLLQRASEAKRSYATLLSVKSMQFGEHEQHIIDHNSHQLKSLLLNSYKEANIDPATVEFVEANGSGLKNEDSMELNVMEEVFCTKNRKTPLKVGSVKSNIGHTESSSLFVSIIKAIIAFECGYIPPNINYTEPNENVSALKTGKIQVVTENTPFIGDVIGITSFGFINAFSHVILKRNNRVKQDVKKVNDENDLPKLILASGRNEENARETLNKIKKFANDAEYIALTNRVFGSNINSHFFRTFTVVPNPDENRTVNVWNVTLKKRPIWFIFSGMGSQWHGMGTHLLKLPIFLDSIKKIDAILKPRGIDIMNILTDQNPKLFDNILNSFVGIAAMQIGLVDVLKALDIVPDGLVGHSVGELGCAYADGCCTAEQMILSAYARGRASIETELIKGMMAAVGLGYDEIKNRLPHDVDVACHNSATSCTISGPVDSINAFVTELKAEGIFAKAVNVANIAYHSRYIKPVAPTLLKYLKEVNKESKKRSSKWISSSLPESQWDSDLAQYSSPEYHTNNLLSSVLFENALKHIPNDAVAIEIAPHGLLQAILRGALPPTVTNIPITKRMYGDSIRFLMTAIGNMYANGLHPKIQALYPAVDFPVSRGTPSIHSLPLWDYSEQWRPVCDSNYYNKINTTSGEKLNLLSPNNNIYLAEHKIHDHHILPISYVLCNVWKMYAEINNKKPFNDPIQFQNLRFINDVELYPNSSYNGYIMIQKGTGYFEYNLNNKIIFSGVISFLYGLSLIIEPKISRTLDKTSENFQGSVSKNEIYTILENNGHQLGDNFKNITSFEMYKKDIQGYVKWQNDWVYFLDSLFKFPILENLGTCHIETPVSIRQISIIPEVFENYTDKDVCVNYNVTTKEMYCKGVRILDIKNSPLKLAKLKNEIVKLEEQTFVHFNQTKSKNIDDFVNNSMDVVMEVEKLNLDTTTGKVILCTPYHYGDLLAKECTNVIKKFVEEQLITNSTTLNWENVSKASEDDDSGRYITVTNVNYLQGTTKALANKKYSYVIVCSKQELQDYKDWKIIIQQYFDNNYLALMKKVVLLDGNNTFIKSTDEDFDSSIWKMLEKNELSEQTIYMVSKTEPIEGINVHVKNSLKEYNSQNLKFLFVLDSNAPEFETHKSFYIDQLSKGLIVNIYKNGGWGFYKRNAVRDLNEIKIADNPIAKNISVNSHSELNIRYLGINLKDLVIEANTENEFGPLEYSGLFKNNNTVMGITTFKQMSSQIKYDTLLSWPVPSTWSLEDATTVPLTYAMSYYVFNVLCSLQNDKSVLVTSGLHPLGQAAISISLAKKCDTYTVVESIEQADQLSEIFRALPRSNIFINTNNKFDIKLKMMTKSKGIDIIINLLNGEAFLASFRALADHGKFFHFSKSDMKNQGSIGTRAFLRDLSFSVVSSDMLLNESDDNKKIVQKAFMDGLCEGVIKPFKRSVLTESFSSDKIFNTVKSATNNKVVLSLNVDFEKSKSRENVEQDAYQCHFDQVYVVVGNKSDWIDLAEWLVERGAQKVIIVVKRCSMSTITCRRFDKLISQNVSIQIESDSYLKTKEESVAWLNRLTSSNVLGSMFIVNQCDNKKLGNLRSAFEGCSNKIKMTSFVCIQSKGEHICGDLKSIGLNAVNISWDGMVTQPKNIAKLLMSLDTLLRNSNTIGSSSFVCSERDANKLNWSRQINKHIENYFPETVEELHLLNDKIVKEPGFIEVQTKSPRYSQQKGVLPVFVIPGFKPKLTETFYKHLLYPAFEAQFPENVVSIDELSEILVDKLIKITVQNTVSLIGESWGGIVALKMAQILEAKGIMVTISLMEGDPDILISWAESFNSNCNTNSILHSKYSSLSDELQKNVYTSNEKERNLSNVSFYNKTLGGNTSRALSSIRSRLQALLETRPFSNKLLTTVLVFRYDRNLDLHRTVLNDYCINQPSIHTIAQKDYRHMFLDKDLIRIINGNVIHFNSIGVDLSLSEKYENFNYFVERFSSA